MKNIFNHLYALTLMNFVPPSHLRELDFMIGNGIMLALTHVHVVLDLYLFWFMMKHMGKCFDKMLGWFYWLYDFT
jgi:hypothetical protein